MVMQVNHKRVVWQDVRPVQTQPKPIPKKPTIFQKIRLNISLLFKKIKIRFLNISRKTAILSTIIFIALISAGGYFLYINHFFANNNIDSSSNDKTTVTEKATPEYVTIAPVDKNINDLGGWTLVSRPGSDSFYRYDDKIGDIPISVSQQTLPASLKDDTEQQIEQLAQDIKANGTITVNDLVVHISTSSEGKQYILFGKDGLLISITSNTPITNDQWIKYISSLQ